MLHYLKTLVPFIFIFALIQPLVADEVVLTWVAPAGSVIGFSVERGMGTTSAVPFLEIGKVVVVDPAAIPTFTDKTVAKNTNYVYRIRAYNSGGVSVPSETVTIKTSSAAPSAPTGIKATVIVKP